MRSTLLASSHVIALAEVLGTYAGCFSITYHTRAEFEASEGETIETAGGLTCTYGSIALGDEAHGGWLVALYHGAEYQGTIGIYP